MSDLPEGWWVTDFGTAADIQLGKMLDKAKNKGRPTPYLRNINVRWGNIDTSDVSSMPMSDDERAKFAIQDGDVLVCEGGEPGRAAVWRSGPTDLKFQKAILRVRAGNAASPEWLAYFLWIAARDGTLEQRFTGTTIKHLPRQTLADTPVPLAPLPEQRRIVAKIDSLSAKSSRARDHLDHIPRLVERYKQAVLADIFRNLNCARLRLGDVSEFVTSGSRGWAAYYSDSGPSFIRIANVRRGRAALDMAETQHVRPPPGVEGTRTRVRPGDVLVTITADLGRVGVAADDLGEAYVNQHVALVRLHEPAQGRFVAWFLSSADGQGQLLARDRGMTRAGLGLDDIRDVEVPDATGERQALIVARIETAFAWIDRLAAEATSARNLLERLEHSVLVKAFRGELVPQEPADEPATVLLERIKVKRAEAPKLKRGRRSGAAAMAT